MTNSPAPYRSSPETESDGPVQSFDCESIPIRPGTRVQPRHRSRSGPRSLWVWGLAGAAALAAGLLGFFLGRSVLTGAGP
jgi:hypothetical protein